MLLRIRCKLIMSMILFDTCFGIDFRRVLSSISNPFWEPVGVIFILVRTLFSYDFSDGALLSFVIFHRRRRHASSTTFSRSSSDIDLLLDLGRPLVYFGILLVPFWSPNTLVAQCCSLLLPFHTHPCFRHPKLQ